MRRFSIAGLIVGGMLGAIAAWLGAVVGGLIVSVATDPRAGWSGWGRVFVVFVSISPALGGMLGGGATGACRSRVSALTATLGGALGAWLQAAVLATLMALASDHDLIAYPRPLVFSLLILTGIMPAALGTWIKGRAKPLASRDVTNKST